MAVPSLIPSYMEAVGNVALIRSAGLQYLERNCHESIDFVDGRGSSPRRYDNLGEKSLQVYLPPEAVWNVWRRRGRRLRVDSVLIVNVSIITKVLRKPQECAHLNTHTVVGLLCG